jgi:2-C-methyl-D-erythritol 4-phosphate cytidylyltransferase
MRSGVPKQFLELCGKPVLMRTIETFVAADPAVQVILVLPGMHIATWTELCGRYRFTVPHDVVEGGDSRFLSVKNGLAAVKEDGVVAVHDGVRPLVDSRVIVNCFETAEKSGTAVPVLPLADSVRRIEGNNNYAADRSRLRLVQTPQVFQSPILKTAYRQASDPRFTDDATVVETLGIQINLVEGNPENIKITTPFDLKMAELIWTAKQ